MPIISEVADFFILKPKSKTEQRILKTIWYIPQLRNTLILAIIASIGLPAATILLIFPRFEKLAIREGGRDAIRATRHLSHLLTHKTDLLAQNSLETDFINELWQVAQDFQLNKLKILSPSGSVIFSTDTADIGAVNRMPYFKDQVTKGEIYTQLVKKKPPAMEAQIYPTDLVVTYIPIMHAERFKGAYEVHYDVSNRRERLGHLIFISSLFLCGSAVIFLVALVHTLTRTAREMRERKKSESIQRMNEKRFQTVFQTSPDAIAINRLEDGCYLDINEGFTKLTGYTEGEIIGKTALQIDMWYEPEDRQRWLEDLKQHGEANNLETRFRLKNGTVATGLVSTRVMVLNKEKCIVSITKAIDELKAKEAALQESESQYRTLFDNAGDAIIITDLNGLILRANQVARKRLGCSREETLDMTLTNAGNLSSPDGIKGRFQELHKRKHMVFDAEHVDRHGNHFSIEVSSRLIRYAGCSAVLNIARDISDRKRIEEEKRKLEDQLHHSQKMEAIGTLAGGIAHDFNNILLPVLLHSELGLMDIDDESLQRHHFGEIFKAGNHAKELVKQILAFSRQTEIDPKALNIGPIVKEALKMIRSFLPSTIEIRQGVEFISGLVIADPTQIHQMVMNLCTNAFHAMKEKGGVLDIRLCEARLDSKEVAKYTGLNPGRYIKLSVSDTGHGIEPESLAKIFDPYFTTKEKGEGTGLGLAMVHGIIKKYGGGITVDSELSRGSTFEIILPVIPMEKTEKEIEDPMELPRGNERILVVDDEPSIVGSIKETLLRLGYKVEVRLSSIDALELFKHQPDTFNMVITDQTMPHMTGTELAEELLKIRPGIPVILCTGFSEVIYEETFRAVGIQEVIMKPLVVKQLAESIRNVLDRSK